MTRLVLLVATVALLASCTKKEGERVRPIELWRAEELQFLRSIRYVWVEWYSRRTDAPKDRKLTSEEIAAVIALVEYGNASTADYATLNNETSEELKRCVTVCFLYRRCPVRKIKDTQMYCGSKVYDTNGTRVAYEDESGDINFSELIAWHKQKVAAIPPVRPAANKS